MASGGIPPNEGDKWVPPGKIVGKQQMDARDEEGKEVHAENRKEKTIQRINVDSHDHLMLLKKLKFKDFFLKKHPSFDGEFRYNKDDFKFYLETLCTDKMKIEVEKTVHEFISLLKPIGLDSNVKALLVVMDSNCTSDFEQKLKDRKLDYFLIKPRGCIYTTPEYEEKVREVVVEFFIWMTVHPMEPRYFHFTTENFQKFRIEHENKNFTIERKVGAISFAAVKSAVADELTEAMGLYESDECKFVFTPMQAEAIQIWGPKEKEEYWLFLNYLHSEGRYFYSRKAFLLNQKPAEEYIKRKLTTPNIKALFEVESDNCVNLMAMNSFETDKAVKVLEDSIQEIPIYYTDALLKNISSDDFKQHLDKWKGKYLFYGLKTAMQDPEGVLLATDDIVDDFKDLLVDKFCNQKSRGLEQTYRTDATRAIINPDLFREVEAQVNIREIEEKYHCKISKKFLEPQLVNCWLMGNDHSHILRVHLITGHAESLNVDAVVCPCTSFTFPVNDTFGLYRNTKIEKTTTKLSLNYTKKIMAPDGFLCEEIIFLVTCDPNKAEEVDLDSTVKTALRRADDMSCQSLAIPLQLLPETIMKKNKQAKEIAIALKHLPNLKMLEEVFVCECSYHPSNQINKMWKKIFLEIERCIDFGPLQESAAGMTIPSKESSHGSFINVKVLIGSLVLQQVDAIVNTCGRDLDLNNGAVSKTILLKGGKSIQDEIYKNQKYIRFGEVAVTKGGALWCKHILHSALYSWTPVGNFSLKVLKLAIWNCLTKADELKCSSIAFPSLGTGKLWHPFHLVAETMYHTIQCYEQSHSDTNIRDIYIVLYEKDQECIQQFKAAEKMKQNLYQSREENHPHPFLTGKRVLGYQPVVVDLLPSRSTWRWGSLLRVNVGSGDTGEEMVWDQNESCWNLRLSPPGFLSSISSMSSSLGISPDKYHDICKKRITSIELFLFKNADGYKRQIEDFFRYMNGIKGHFIQHIFIVFPNITFDKLTIESKSIEGHWKPGRKLGNFPVTYMLSGSSQDVSSAKAEIDDIITKMERDLHQSKFSEEGRKGHTENKKEETTQRINVVSHDHLMLLKKLKFKDFFLQKHPNFDGEFRYDTDDSVFYLATSCTEEMKIDIEKTMNEFLLSLKHIILDSKVKALLFKKYSKCASDFKQKLKDRKVNCFLIKPRGCIYTTPENIEKMKEMVDEIFLCMTIRPEEPRYFHFTTENFQKFRIGHENKDFIFERNVGVISFAAVKSTVADKLTKAMSLYESDECKFVYTPMQVEAIQKWGPQKREEYWLFLNNLYSEGRYIYSRKAFLLDKKPTEEYIMQKLTESKIKALFEVESDYCVNLIALDSIEADRAVKVLEDSVHEIPILYTDTLMRDISSNDFKHHFDKWKGKYSFEGLKTVMQDPEGILLATDDIVDDLKDLLNGKFCRQKSRGLEETYRTYPTRAIINPEENSFRAVEAQVHVRKIEEKD